MKQAYSNERLHKFITKFVKSEGGIIKDISEEYFTIKLPGATSPIKYTYQPAIATEKKLSHIAVGSTAFEEIIKKCLNKGVLSSAKIINKIPVEDSLKNFFKDYDYHCEESEKITINKKEYFVCTHANKCFHKINNAKIESIKITNSYPIEFYLFVYSILLNNKLKKNEEIINLLLDKEGNPLDTEVLKNNSIDLIDSKSNITTSLFDKLNTSANELIDVSLVGKKQVFDLQLKKQINQKMLSLERKIDDERLQKKIAKKNKSNEQEWKLRKGNQLNKERDALETFVSIKFKNFLCLNSEKIHYEIKLNNGAVINSSIVLGIDNKLSVNCSSCDELHSEGYGTEDGKYLCKECINQSLDSNKFYSKNYKLTNENTLNEFIENENVLKCSVCNKQNSKSFLFKCNNNKSFVCVNCFDFCNKCEGLFSIKNLISSKKSNYFFCPDHTVQCSHCNDMVGITEVKRCLSLGTKFCLCTRFKICSFCNQSYSSHSLRNGKCLACNNLREMTDLKLIFIVKKYDPKLSKIKKWIVGSNKLNSIIIAKGLISNKLLVVKNKNVLFEKKLPKFSLRGIYNK
jgi:hypothetical protein